MIKRDIRYIVKKIIIGVGITLCLMFIKSCNVSAATYSIDNEGTAIYWSSGASTSVNLGTNYYSASNLRYDKVVSNLQIIGNSDDPYSPQLFEGSYLVEFYVFGLGYFYDISCDNLTSNFQNVNMTTGNLVANEIKSSCLNMYKTKYLGLDSWRILYKFDYKSSNSAATINELRFTITSNLGFFGSLERGINYGFDLSTIKDYSSEYVDSFNSDMQNGIMINQNDRIIEQNQFMIDQNGTINQSINDTTNTLKDDSVDTADNSANEWANKSLSDNVVSDMVTMPITLMRAYLNGLNGSCSQFNLGNLMGTDLTLPCIDLQGYFGALWNVIDVLFSGFMIFAIGKKFVKIFNDFTNLKDNQVNELYGGGN